MSRRRISSANLTTIIVTLIGTIGTIATAYFAFRSNLAPIELPLNATQTAAAKITDFPSSVPSMTTLSTNTPIPLATETEIEPPTLLPTQVIESPTPTPVILFSDSFDNNANDWRTGSRTAGIYTQNSKITDGALQLDVDFHGKGLSWFTIPDFREENFDISFDSEVVQFSSRSIVGIVILFRISNGGNTAYAIELRNDGRLGLLSSTTLTQDGLWLLIHEESSDAFQIKEGMVNNFRIKVLGQRFTVYANGKELFAFEDNSVKGIGEIGIGLSGESQKTAIVKFDNLVITK